MGLITMKKMLILKITGALSLLGATAGGVAAGVTKAPVAASKIVEAQSAVTETPPASNEADNPGTDLRNTEYLPKEVLGTKTVTWDSMAAERKWMERYAYKLTKANRAFERSYYTFEAVRRQTNAMMEAMMNFNFLYSEEMAAVVYNFVQMIDAENTDGTVAWETKGLLKEGKKDIGLIYLEGGPNSNASFDRMTEWNLNHLDLGAFFMLKQAQMGLYPLQIVGREGASATNNKYMQRLKSSDSNRLQQYKSWYEKGRLGNSVLLWAIGGNLDLDLGKIYGAMAIATVIVGTARTSALTKQLYESGYERVSLVGLSYGMTLGLTILANDLMLLDSLYRVSLGENALGSGKIFYTEAPLSEETINEENKKEEHNWNRGIWDLNGSYNIRNMLKNLFRPNNKEIPYQGKISLHVARDDDHNWTNLYNGEEKYFEQTLGIADYQQYGTGGHGIWFARRDMIEWVLGLGWRETRYQ